MEPYAQKGQRTFFDMGCTKRKRESGPPWELCTRHNTELACNHTRSPGTTSTCGGGHQHALLRIMRALYTAGSNSCNEGSRAGQAAAGVAKVQSQGPQRQEVAGVHKVLGFFADFVKPENSQIN
eukprot:1137662-Pelagomonas_calceolata.AAC.4